MSWYEATTIKITKGDPKEVLDVVRTKEAINDYREIAREHRMVDVGDDVIDFRKVSTRGWVDSADYSTDCNGTITVITTSTRNGFPEWMLDEFAKRFPKHEFVVKQYVDEPLSGDGTPDSPYIFQPTKWYYLKYGVLDPHDVKREFDQHVYYVAGENLNVDFGHSYKPMSVAVANAHFERLTFVGEAYDIMPDNLCKVLGVEKGSPYCVGALVAPTLPRKAPVSEDELAALAESVTGRSLSDILQGRKSAIPIFALAKSSE